MPRPPNGKAAEAERLFAQGMAMVEIAKKLEVSDGTVRSWKKRYGWGGKEEKNNATLQKKKRNVAKGKSATKEGADDGVAEVMQNPALTDKQRLFCLYYVRCFNATKAYQKAFGVDYSTAASISYRLMENDGVKKEIMRLKKNRLNREMLSEEDIVQRYIDIAYADMNDYVEIKGGSMRFKDSDGFDGLLIKKVSSGKTDSIELYDSTKALQWLSDHMDLATGEQRARIKAMEALSQLRLKQADDESSGNEEVAEWISGVLGEDVAGDG
ncbi:MAG: terminase small subunit [Lachnospiraceae bacterium]|nr:terminase small subunit [Lachnospiraceae bacterium]